MSLLDDVSIVVTPNAYKAGTLYGVLPTATESSELITCGDFACADPNAAWTRGTGTTISSGVANITAGSSGGSALSQTGGIFVSGKRFKVTFTISNYSSGSIAVSNVSPTTYRSANGTYTLDAIGAGGDFLLFSNGFVGSVDNISVIEVTNSDMDVTRATAATRVDENGLVNYAEILGSELVTNGDFDSNITGWSAKDCTIAWDSGKLKVDNSSGNQNGGAFQNIGLVTGKTYQMNVTMQLLTGSSNGTFTLFTSAAGGTGQTSVYTGSALVVGGAAVTETFYFTPGSGDVSIQFTCDEANATYTIDNVSVKEVTRNNVPRIDYTGGGCPHILAEPQRTNVLQYSQAIGSNGFSGVGTSIVADQTTSPDGTQNAVLHKEDSSNGSHFMFKDFNLSSGQDYTISIFAKSNGVNRDLRFGDGGVGWSSGFNISYDLSEGTASSGGVIENFGNGWFRCSVTATTNATTSRLIVYNTLNGVTGYQGDNSSGVFLYGFQIEAGSYPTSYIPTSGSSVTRNQDIFTRDGISSLINSTEGVLFVEMAALENVNDDERTVSLSDGTNVNTIRLQFNTLNNNVRVFVGNGATQVNSNITISDITNFNKFAFKYKQNDFALWINGSEVITDTSGNTFAAGTLNKLGFVRGDNTEYLFGKVRQLQVYKTALTDAQLTSLTT